jgi:multimeric flavodoxin WrbA
MKVLMINGSPNANGNTATALKEMAKVFEEEGVEVEIVHVGNKAIRGCIGCRKCFQIGKCVFDDLVNETAPKLAEADGVVLGSPVYYASANATLMAFVTRLFYSTFNVNKTMKVGAAICAARRGGLSATYDEMNKFFGISGMPIASGQYWNSVHGVAPGQAAEDAEGMQGMRTLAKNMTFLMKSIALGKEAYGIPEKERTIFTNFIR